MKHLQDDTEIGKAFRIIYNRLKSIDSIESNDEPKHICTNCKYRHMVRAYDQEWGYYPIVENYCDKDKSLMHILYSKGNGKHFTEECDFFEYGEGVIEQSD